MERLSTAAFAIALAEACSSKPAPAPEGPTYRGGPAPHSLAADTEMIPIPAGEFITGSPIEEREQAYADHAASSGDDAARRDGRFDNEREPHPESLPAFLIDRAPVTNAMYAEYLADARLLWPDGAPDDSLADHPVVGVTHADAVAYCGWRGTLVGAPRHLPSALQYEKAARGDGANAYPWGPAWDASRLNSAASALGATTPVGSYPGGESSYGLVDAAGNVAQWTSTPWPGVDGAYTVKGSSWADHPGWGRAAAARGAPGSTRAPHLGFRCAG